MSKTKAFEGEFLSKPTLAIFKVDEDGEKKEGAKPIIAFGVKKAKALVAHLEEIKDFVEQYDEE